MVKIKKKTSALETMSAKIEQKTELRQFLPGSFFPLIHTNKQWFDWNIKPKPYIAKQPCFL